MYASINIVAYFVMGCYSHNDGNRLILSKSFHRHSKAVHNVLPFTKHNHHCSSDEFECLVS